MKLSGLGEKGVVEKLSSILDVGDDAAYVRFDDSYLVASSDALYEKTHIPKGMTYDQIGRFIASVNLSDIASMGAKPFGFLLSYVGPDISYPDFEELVLGAKSQCEACGAAYIGGDTKYSPELVLSGTALGRCEKPVLRSGASPGDRVCVTGPLGAGAAFEIEDCPARLREKALCPVPRVSEGVLLGEYASSMTDISDSLSISLHDLSFSSRLGFKVEKEKIPVLSGSSLEYALFSGGDYELLFTVPEESIDLLRPGLDFSEIGVVFGGQGVFLEEGDKISSLLKTGYEHFRP